MDSGSYTGALLRDLSKAFDSVPHQLLLREVVEIGCSTRVLDWFWIDGQWIIHWCTSKRPF